MTPFDSDHIFPEKFHHKLMWSIFSAICYDERQAPIVRGVHLVIFSTSFQWKSINLLFHIFRQEITVSVELNCFTAVYSVRNQQCLKLRKVHTCQFINQLRTRYLLEAGRFNYDCFKNRVLSFSQPDSLIPLIFNAYFTTLLRSQHLRSIIKLLFLHGSL